MATYAPPAWRITRFEMRLVPNLRSSASPYTGDVQVLDLMGERWLMQVTIAPTNSPLKAAALEAWFDRMKGSTHRVAMGHQRLAEPQGTLRGGGITTGWVTGAGAAASWVTAAAGASTWVSGDPTVAVAVPQFANTAYIRHFVGRTLEGGDLLKFGGQLVRVLAPVVFDATGLALVEFGPRARQAIPAGSPVEWAAPTADFILKPGTDGVPTTWAPGYAEGASFELIEVYP